MTLKQEKCKGEFQGNWRDNGVGGWDGFEYNMMTQVSQIAERLKMLWTCDSAAERLYIAMLVSMNR